MTDEEGTVSGDLEVRLDDSGKGLVRYRGTDTWLTIGNLDAEPAHPWDGVARLAAAIEAGIGARDAAGNTVPFEVFPEEDPAHANPAVAEDTSTSAATPASADVRTTADTPGTAASDSAAPAETTEDEPSSPADTAASTAPDSAEARTAATDSAEASGSAQPPASLPSTDAARESSAATGTPVADGGGDGADQDGAHRPDQDQGEGPGERPAER